MTDEKKTLPVVNYGCDHADCKPHPCPYQSDVNNDSDYRCTCCEACTDQCAEDI